MTNNENSLDITRTEENRIRVINKKWGFEITFMENYEVFGDTERFLVTRKSDSQNKNQKSPEFAQLIVSIQKMGEARNLKERADMDFNNFADLAQKAFDPAAVASVSASFVELYTYPCPVIISQTCFNGQLSKEGYYLQAISSVQDTENKGLSREIEEAVLNLKLL